MKASDPDHKPWAVLAYTVADDRSGGSSLDAAVKEELRAICDAADFGQVSVAAQVDFKRPRGSFRGSITAKPARRRAAEAARAEDHPLWRKILSGVEQSLLRVEADARELNAASSGVLEGFLRYGVGACPADRYLVYFYGHAAGPMGLFYDTGDGERRASTLRLNDLAGSLATVDRRASLVVFRDCFMNTLETAFQLRQVAEFMIASQAEAPIAGVWPWLNFMATLMPSADTADVARAVALQLAQFLDHAENRGRFADVPYALIDLGQADAIAAPLRRLADELEEARGNPRRRAACADALEAARIGEPGDPSNPGDPALLDVPTLCANLQALGRDQVATAARALDEVVRERLVRWHHSQKGAHRGVSLYYKPATARTRERSFIEPIGEDAAAADAAYYRQLALSQASGWDRIALAPLARG
jgi:hypothetical protein